MPVTTDGFITNLPQVEEIIFTNPLISEYKKIRKSLSDDEAGLELKNSGKGIIA